jgi:hypothetical protein
MPGRAVLLLAATALLAGAGCSGGGGASSDGSLGSTFPCGAATCRADVEYCFQEQWNGAQKVGPVCRPLSSGCHACGCAKPDAQTISMMCTATSARSLLCTDGTAVVDDQTSTSTLVVRCDIS